MAVSISTEQLTTIMPTCRNAADWCPPLNEAMSRYEIDNPNRVAAFLAQIAQESGELQRLIENLNYSAKGLMKTWPRRFRTLAAAQKYARQQEKIANHVYASRLGNGDEASGDGWRFRGRGLIQVTGRENYRVAGRALTLPLEDEPDLLLQQVIQAPPGRPSVRPPRMWRDRPASPSSGTPCG